MGNGSNGNDVFIMKVKVNVLQKRVALYEGRTTGMGFAFCKKVDENIFETLQPISPCKDYLNDVLYNQNTGNAINACGLNLKATKDNTFKDDYAYIAIQIMKANRTNGDYINTTTQRNFNKDQEWLAKNQTKVQEFINYIEDILNIDYKTEIYEANDDIFLLKTDAEWAKNTYLISFYTLITRCALYWTDNKLNPMEVLNLISNNTIESQYVKRALVIIDKVKEGKRDLFEKQNFNAFDNCPNSIHDIGICCLKT